MALIDITAEIKGSSETTVVPIRIISATAALTGASASGVGRKPAPVPEEPVEKSPEPKTGA
jgi:hypothetical protein